MVPSKTLSVDGFEVECVAQDDVIAVEAFVHPDSFE